MKISITLLGLLAFLVACGNKQVDSDKISASEFESLLHDLADGWNTGNAQKASNLFTEDAIYIEPPDKQLYRGRNELFTFFGGDSGRAGEMQMTWHHVMFDETKQIGSGEFTFTYGSSVHGMVIIKVKEGKIYRWREYWYESPLEWEEFVGESVFENS